MIEFLVERNLKKMKDEELVDFYIQNSQSMSLSLKKKFVIESAKRELSKLGVNDCSVKVNLLFEGCGGAFREAKHKKEILINERVLLNSSPIEVFGIIKHECTHALQCKKEKEFPIDDYAIKINYSRSRYNESLNFCDFCFENCQMYITNEFDISFEANELAEMFYYLGAAEREAFILEYARNEELCEKNGILHSKTNKVGEQANFFRKHYKCFNLTDEEIFEIIDLSYRR